MAQWIEVKVRYDKMTDSGKTVKVTDPYLVDAVSCSEAEARVVEEISSFVNDFNVLNVGKTKISEIFWDETGDRFYKVKVNFITIDEKSGVEKRKASFILVQASTFTDALANFNKGMKGTMADYEIEAIAETKIVDVYRYQAPAAEPAKVAERVAADKGVQRAVKKFRDAIPEGMKVSISASLSDGTEIPERVVVDKSKPRNDDD
ncbi:DUF4494 domain-containing protein [Duncaniella muris]|uniref:DUF4494 domain-containing protein n=1 Tax=Duncaniella muris TaxID=2094150 RepID=UPI0026755A4F|nr:DUF4494 domain-containing protein [Duncaniella muris]